MATKPKHLNRWAVLCPGPSLAHCDMREVDGAQRIAVSRAGKTVPEYEWFCGMDGRHFTDPLCGPPHPSVGLVVSGRRRQMIESGKYKGCPTFSGMQWVNVDEIGLAPELRDLPDHQWITKSFSVAIILAWHLGARHIDLYGCDLTGRAYVDGSPTGYGEEVWSAERDSLAAITAWLRARGISLARAGVV